MFFLGLRIILVVLYVSFFVYIGWRVFKNVRLTDKCKEEIDEAKIVIKEDMKQAAALKDVDDKKLKNAREKLDKFKKKGKHDSQKSRGDGNETKHGD